MAIGNKLNKCLMRMCCTIGTLSSLQTDLTVHVIVKNRVGTTDLRYKHQLAIVLERVLEQTQYNRPKFQIGTNNALFILSFFTAITI